MRHSPEQGVKTLVAETESLARRAAEAWVDTQHDGQDECDGEEGGTLLRGDQAILEAPGMRTTSFFSR